MHLEADILKGKYGYNKKLISESKDELKESRKGKALLKALQNKKMGKPYRHIKGHEGNDLTKGDCKYCGKMSCSCN